jgi:hypothetical protein
MNERADIKEKEPKANVCKKKEGRRKVTRNQLETIFPFFDGTGRRAGSALLLTMPNSRTDT